MLSLTYTLSTFSDFIKQLAERIDTTATNNSLRLPEAVGTGIFRVCRLRDGPEVLLYDCKLAKTVALSRRRDSDEYYTLVLDEVNDADSFRMTIDEKNMGDDGNAVVRRTAFYLTSFLYEVETELYKGIHIRGIRILLSVDWMQHYLQLTRNEEVLEKYIALKTAGVWYKPVNDELLTLLRELLESDDAPPLFIDNKIYRIIELFFSWLYNEMKLLPDTAGVARRDIETAQRIEALLTDDITRLPPTIRELAREAAMSESKLKKVFKGVYGLPPYEYYQRQRMQKAKLMLTSGEYSVKDVGYTLGYANLSNFTLAFKKVFGKLPSHLLSK